MFQKALEDAKIQCAMQNSVAAIAGHSTVPYPNIKAGQNPRRSTSLLGPIHGSLVYDAHDPSLLRFRRWPNPPEALKDLPVFLEWGQSAKAEADYILFSKQTYYCWLRDQEYVKRGVDAPGYMLRVPMMEGWWILGAGVGPRREEKAMRPASPTAEHKEDPHGQGPSEKPQTYFVRKSLVVVAIAIVVALISRALFSSEP